LDTIVE